MILAFDTFYSTDYSKTVCISFDQYQAEEPIGVYSEELHEVADYKSGEFYKRELPCILSLYQKLEIENTEAIIIDGYAILDGKGKLGLGGHLFEKLDSQIPVVGVAKTSFHNNKKYVREIFRGSSKNPLYITSKGIDPEKAAENIQRMHGEFRIPTLLKRLDAETRKKS